MSEQKPKETFHYSDNITRLEKEFKFKVSRNTDLHNRFHINFDDGRTFVFTRPSFDDIYSLINSSDRTGTVSKALLDLLRSDKYLTCTSQDKSKAMDFTNNEQHRKEGFALWELLLTELALFSEKKI